MKVNKHQVHGDDRGKLIALESGLNIPFEIKRVFYIFGVKPDQPRGNHAHYKTKQYLVAVRGSCNISLDNGMDKVTVKLAQPEAGIMQDALVWGSMHDFSDDCVLMVLASEAYSIQDYIFDYQEFRQLVVNY